MKKLICSVKNGRHSVAIACVFAVLNSPLLTFAAMASANQPINRCGALLQGSQIESAVAEGAKSQWRTSWLGKTLARFAPPPLIPAVVDIYT